MTDGSGAFYRAENMAGDTVKIAIEIQWRLHPVTKRCAVGATRMKSTPGRRIYRTGHITLQQHSFLFSIDVGDWH